MPKPLHHIFVCGQSRPEGHPRGSCGTSGAGNVFQSFGSGLTVNKLLDKVALTQAGCLGPCHLGANVLVYPEGIMYTQVTAEDVSTIIDQHLINGKPVIEKIAPTEVW